MIKKVLITGATGFVGYHLINKALEAGLEVHAAVRPETDRSHLLDLPIHYVNLDYQDPVRLKEQLETGQYHYIIHAAGITKAKTLEAYNKVNATYSKNLALAAKEAAIPLEKFVLVSSLAAIGPISDLSKSIAADAVPSPVTNYGRSKLLAEQYLADISGLPLITIRPTAVYGPREKDLFIIINTINKGIDPHIGRFGQQLSFIYVKDLAAAIVAALSSGLTGRSYNISDGRGYSRYALADEVKKTLHKKAFRIHLPVSFVGMLASVMDFIYKNRKDTPALNKEKMAELTAVNWACDIEALVEELNFKPQYDLENGVKETIRWYQANHWL
ncbi:putative UDP-glucose 4-epimerase [Pedobacter sp. BAL39]|uniref:NAD-dependent epimerase/dehydratase family protein n=1 Tax=Pedobacter sp. BAL39 TaxID=391596 RepID=UPI0001559FC4|nr:NAD(P)-dependent oxidoreductase [Pedobacter sp. BAL39]EDM38417.1 putative UDP-glucose 4-epimerase [Pedobacter sp. BAL39]